MHGTQWAILLYWVPSDRFLLRFCDTYSDAELSSHPAKGRFARTAELKNVFHPVKSPFARTAELKNVFHPVKGPFARTKML